MQMYLCNKNINLTTQNMHNYSIKSIIMAVATAATSFCSCTNKTNAPHSEDSDNKKTLICYFSATGTTAKAANRIAKLTGGEIHEIIPESRYTDADLEWRDSLSRCYIEMHNRNFRPIIIDSVPNMNDYQIVFIGYPNWWNTAPTIINTFIESNDLSNKVIVPFMTSGSSSITHSEAELKEAYPNLTFAKGLLMNDVSDEDIKNWIKDIGL